MLDERRDDLRKIPGFGATLLLALQPQIKAWITSRRRRVPLAVGCALQLAVSVYGGYFGAGMGILMLALFGLFVDGDIHAHNAVKAWLGLLINLLASLLLLRQGLVDLGSALYVSAGSVIGGYLTARVMQRIDPTRLRRLVVGLGLVLGIWFLARIVRV
jgi:uncharacterized membrane protein YfcA